MVHVNGGQRAADVSARAAISSSSDGDELVINLHFAADVTGRLWSTSVSKPSSEGPGDVQPGAEGPGAV